MASMGYDSQLNESMPVIGQGNGINGQIGSMPAIKRRVYSNYDKKAYMQDLHEIIREQMNKGQNANARQNLMIKRNQKVAQDDFKDADRQIKVNRKASTDQPERGMGLLNRNIEKDKLEREAMKQQYRHDIMAQVLFGVTRSKKRKALTQNIDF
jgi:hypothetical protein